jgi:hypothetical protein
MPLAGRGLRSVAQVEIPVVLLVFRMLSHEARARCGESVIRRTLGRYSLRFDIPEISLGNPLIARRFQSSCRDHEKLWPLCEHACRRNQPVSPSERGDGAPATLNLELMVDLPIAARSTAALRVAA